MSLVKHKKCHLKNNNVAKPQNISDIRIQTLPVSINIFQDDNKQQPSGQSSQVKLVSQMFQSSISFLNDKDGDDKIQFKLNN
ncbi:hypothetical protein DERP_006012 [Dermatophagoides pteronyssinus]|uniref:Uncharacterized protein n=1 Tax=Dermatophagoides pteronyssinus TaxID=6956 RepID=A0ABQ8JS24_DERPT|nr:hypothetical protein DERP_006012 [Dermatophagoides pteronyssinus]